MRRFLALTSILMIALVLACVFSRMVGAAQPNGPAANIDIEACNDHYCRKVIIAGKTLWAATLQILSTVSNKEQPNSEEVIVHAAGIDEAYFVFRSDIVNIEVRTTTASGFFRLGDLLVARGLPCSVTLTDDALNLNYSTFFVRVPRDRSQNENAPLLTPDTPIVQIAAPAGPCRLPLSEPSWLNIYMGWCGFASAKNYTRYCVKPWVNDGTN